MNLKCGWFGGPGHLSMFCCRTMCTQNGETHLLYNIVMDRSHNRRIVKRQVEDHGVLYKQQVRILPLSCVDDLIGFAPCVNKSIALNTFLNTHIEMKKLRFHTPDKQGKSKCHKLHVGKANPMCPELRVHGCAMESVKTDKYLGDFVSVDGSNTATIQDRVSKGNCHNLS